MDDIATHLDFFRGIAQAAFANPFGPQRRQIDAELAGMSADADRDDVVDALLARVRDVLARIRRFDVRKIPEPDRRAVQLTLLFDVFHRHAHDFDDLIERQSAAGADPVAAPFGDEVLAALQDVVLDAARAERMLAVLYQVRRAFYFVSRSLTGSSASMQHLRERVWQNIFTDDIGMYETTLWARMEDFSTFLYGETGTGKGTAAAAIGRSGWIGWDGRRKRFAHGFDDGFVPINLSQFPESLIESELFGHRKGAFTGAVDGYDGVFARCRPHGTIFLDEIGEVSEPVQIKLLRVLQERSFTPVGSHEEVPFRGRVVAATNRPPATLRAEGRMRDDFFYRLCSDVVEVPPLRVRITQDKGELGELVARIVERMLGGGAPEVEKRVLDVIDRRLGADYPWPGNVRELEQCVRRVLLTQDYKGDVGPRGADDPDLAQLRLSAADLVARYCGQLYSEGGTDEGVGRIVGLDRRTVKRHVDAARTLTRPS